MHLRVGARKVNSTLKDPYSLPLIAMVLSASDHAVWHLQIAHTMQRLIEKLLPTHSLHQVYLNDPAISIKTRDQIEGPLKSTFCS